LQAGVPDHGQIARTEASLVAANIHGRKHAMSVLGEQHPQAAWEHVITELATPRTLDLPDNGQRRASWNTSMSLLPTCHTARSTTARVVLTDR